MDYFSDDEVEDDEYGSEKGSLITKECILYFKNKRKLFGQIIT